MPPRDGAGGQRQMVATVASPERGNEMDQLAHGTRPRQVLPLLPPDSRRLGGSLDVHESGRRIVRYQVVSFALMRLLGGWLAKIPEYDLKLEIGRHVWQDAQAAEALRVRSSELRVPTDA